MLTSADEYPIHQTAEPIALSGTDRNFYDRSWFGGYAPDGELVFQLAFGVYPHLNIADAHFSVLRDGVQHCLHASRWLNMERMDLRVGPIRIEIEQPLQRLRLVVDEHDGIAADLVFEGRAFPIQEPRFTWRLGPRTYLDYTRFTQNGRWSGWVSVDGVRTVLGEGTVGTRDRSWGVRPVGERDPQPVVPEWSPQFFWVWTPVNFERRSAFFHVQADHEGNVINTRAVLCPDGAAGPGDLAETGRARQAIDFEPDTRYPAAATVELDLDDGSQALLRFAPVQRFLMRGVGYWHPEWGHGRHHGELRVAREDERPADADPADPSALHVHSISRVTLEHEGSREEGIGTLETYVAGTYAPYGFVDVSGPAQRS